MLTTSNVPSAVSPRRWFHAAALLMLIGATAAFVQKGHESAVGATVAKRVASGVQETDEHTNAVQRIIRDAEFWQVLSLAAVFSAIVSWGVALWRREKLRGARVVIVALFALYVMLELTMV